MVNGIIADSEVLEEEYIPKEYLSITIKNKLFRCPSFLIKWRGRMGRKIVSFLLSLVLLSSVILAHICIGLSYWGFVVYVDPQFVSVRVGHIFSINITVANVPSPGLWAYELRLYYNNSLLEPISAQIPEDHFLKPTLPPNGEQCGGIFIIDDGKINQTEGTVSFAATLLGAEPGKTGSGTLANITFVVITSGKSALKIGGYTTAEPKFADGNGDMISSYDYTINHGYVECLPPPPPPIPPPPPTPGEQTLTFNFMGIYGYLTFPEECHPNDALTYELIVAAEPEGIHLNYFKLNITCDTLTGQKILYLETIENKDLPETWILNKSISLTVPSDAYGKTYCTIEAETYRGFTTCDSAVGVSTTYIRKVTYEELQTAYQELLNQYNFTLKELQHWMNQYQSLNSTYYQLLNLYNATVAELDYWRIEYHKLNATYQELVNQYNITLEQLNQWIKEYGMLNNTYSQLLKNYASLNSTYQKLQTDYNALKSSYDSLDASFRSLNSSYNLLKSDYESLQAEHSDLLGKYDALNLTYQDLKLNYSSLMLSFGELKFNLTSLQAQYDNLLSKYNSLNSTYYALLEEYDVLKSGNNMIMRELWMTRVLWFVFLAILVATIVYIIYLTKKR
jgi:predicted nuclease with TOPRIM domain